MPPNYVSNEIEDFEQGGGLYPGGTGIIEDIGYVLWDYNGKMAKDSVLAVHMKFQPTDGSNEGKPLEQYWSAGDAASFAPDPTGGFLIGLKARTAQSDNSKWAFVLKKFRDNCGLPPGSLSGKESGKEGIKALIRSEVTFTMGDAPKYDIQNDNDKKDANTKKYPDKILYPTKAKFPWEKGAGKSTKASAPATTAAAAPSNGTAAASDGEIDISLIIKNVVTAAGGSMLMADLPKELLGAMADVDRTKRTGLIKQAKDEKFIEALAKENEWTFDGKELVI